PIWAIPVPSNSAASKRAPNRRDARNARSGLPITTSSRTPPISNGSRTKIVGSNSMPTETKNKTAKNRSRHDDGPDREQVSQRKMQADAEHQQNDADLG